MDVLALIVAAYIALLADPAFARREAASEALGRPAAYPMLALIEAAAKSPDPEVAARADRLVRLHRRAFAADWVTRQGALPWIDSLPFTSDRDAAVFHYLEAARAIAKDTGHAGPDWPVYRAATRLWLIERIVDGEDVGTLAETLGEMRARVANWLDHNSYEPRVKEEGP